MQVVSILFAAAFTLATCLALGKMLLRAVGAKLYRSEELFLGFVSGAACLSTIVLVLGAFSLVYWWVFLTLGCVALGVAYLSGALRFTRERLPGMPWPWLLLFVSVYGLFAILDLGNALAPEASPDGVLYHVAFPALYFREHRIPAITTNFFSNFSQGMEMLFLFAFSFGKHSAAAMTHLLFTLLLPWGMLSYARRIGAPVAGVVGGLLVFLSPNATWDGSVAYVDVGLAAVVFAAFYWIQIWRTEQNALLLVPAGLAGGFAYGIKYTAFLTVFYALAVVAWRQWRTRRPVWQPCALLLLSSFILVAPWMIKNAIVLGNPVSPFGNRVFRNPNLYVSTEADYRSNMDSLHGMSIWRVPYEVTTRGGSTQGLLGPIFLVVVPLALLAMTSPAGRQLLLAGWLFALPFCFFPVARILLPALPFVSLAFGLVVSRWPQAALATILLHALMSWPSEIPKYADRYAIRPMLPDWRAALRLTPEAEFLKRRIEEYGLETLLDAKVPPGERVFSFGGFSQAYHSPEVLVEWESTLGVRLGEALRAAMQGAFQPTQHLDFHFEPRAVRKLRLVETARGGAGDWSISELRVFRGGAELARKPEWRLRGFPNPWDVQLAFDNSPLTRWSSREEPRPGMFLELDFGTPQSIDRVTVERTPDQAGTQMQIEFESAPEHWQTLASQPAGSTVAMPVRLRRAAIEELERHGVRWLVVHDLYPGARDFRLRQQQWGIAAAGTAGRFTLYRLE
ncbi:MAG TPA: hypothetical protein VEV17_01510 [Bryobacteraceae bacterium]|nr:hypothetical protein [Bryobacteraceae bacterium]